MQDDYIHAPHMYNLEKVCIPIGKVGMDRYCVGRRMRLMTGLHWCCSLYVLCNYHWTDATLVMDPGAESTML